MRRISMRGFNVVLVFTLLIAILGSSLIREVHAWGMTVSPPSQTIPPGGTATFSVSVFYTPPEAPLPPVNLLVSPPELGITATFSPNGQPIPFTSIMTVHVDPGKPPGTYTLSVWANPSGTPFPGPGNKAVAVTVVVGATVPFDFTLQLSPPIREIKRGETARYDVIISYSHPMYSGTVITIQNILGLGPGMAPHLSTAPPRLSISTTPGTPLGSYNIVLVGSALGKTHDASATLIVTAEEPPQQTTTTQQSTQTVQPTPTEPFQFTLEVSPPLREIDADEVAEFIINVVPAGGGAPEPVTLSVGGLPGEIRSSFNVRTDIPPFTSLLTLDPASSASPGSYTFKISGSAGSLTDTATATLVIKEKSRQVPTIFLTARAQEGGLIIASGSVSPPIPGGEPIEVTYIGPSGERIVHHVPIKGGGDFEDTLQSAAPGTWSIVAEWRGSPEYAPAKSPPASVTVEAKPAAAPSILQDPMFIAVIVLAAVVIGLAAALMKRKRAPPPERQATAMTKYCVNCGAELKPGKPFCSSCGERVE